LIRFFPIAKRTHKTGGRFARLFYFGTHIVIGNGVLCNKQIAVLFARDIVPCIAIQSLNPVFAKHLKRLFSLGLF